MAYQIDAVNTFPGALYNYRRELTGECVLSRRERIHGVDLIRHY